MNHLLVYGQKVPVVFLFGDSYGDTGNNYFIGTTSTGNFLPYGRDFKDHIPTGTISNGKLMSDYFGSFAIPLYHHAFTIDHSSDSPFNSLIDYYKIFSTAIWIIIFLVEFKCTVFKLNSLNHISQNIIHKNPPLMKMNDTPRTKIVVWLV